MKCCKYYIAFCLLFSLITSTAQAQNSSFDAMVNEKMTEFTIRDLWQKPDTLMSIMQIEPGEQIAEIGSGEGYFTLKLSHQVGPDGKLLALDINDIRLNVLRLLKRYFKLQQLENMHNRPDVLGLQPASLDTILLGNNYH